jgi:hypothetical protein
MAVTGAKPRGDDSEWSICGPCKQCGTGAQVIMEVGRAREAMGHGEAFRPR